MVTKAQVLEEKKALKRKFKKGTSLAKIEDRITELELKIEELENGS